MELTFSSSMIVILAESQQSYIKISCFLNANDARQVEQERYLFTNVVFRLLKVSNHIHFLRYPFTWRLHIASAKISPVLDFTHTNYNSFLLINEISERVFLTVKQQACPDLPALSQQSTYFGYIQHEQCSLAKFNARSVLLVDLWSRGSCYEMTQERLPCAKIRMLKCRSVGNVQ